jgi:hypothetical protein
MSSISSTPGPELELLLVVPPLPAPLVVVPEEEDVELGCPPSPAPEELDCVPLAELLTPLLLVSPLEVPVDAPLLPLAAPPVIAALEVPAPDVAPPVVLPDEEEVVVSAPVLDAPDDEEEDEVVLPDELAPPSGEVIERSSIPATISQPPATQPAVSSSNAARQRFTDGPPEG